MACREDDRPQHEGDPRRRHKPTTALYANDVRFHFPGESSFAPGASSKEEPERWLERFVDVGLQIYPDQVILEGFPWRQTICVRGPFRLDQWLSAKEG